MRRSNVTSSARVLFAATLVAGCQVALEVPDDAAISCQSDADCPEGRFCRLPIGRCRAAEDTRGVISRPTLEPPDDQTAIKNDDLLEVGGQGEIGATVFSARLLDVSDDSDVLDVTPGTIRVDAEGHLHGLIPATGLQHGTGVALEVVLELAGEPSDPRDSRSLPVSVDNVPPESASATVVQGAAVATAEITLSLAATGATWVRLDGDLADSDNVRRWLPISTSLSVSLSAGDGVKTVVAAFRDEAHNATNAVTTVTLDTQPPASAPRLDSPWGVTRVRDLDQVTVGGHADPGTSIAQAHLVSFGTAGEELTAADCSADVASAVTLEDGAFSGSFNIESPCSDAAEIALRVLVQNAAGATSEPLASTSQHLAVDNDAPAATAAELVLLPYAQDGFSRQPDITLLLSATEPAGSAIEVLIDGDLQASARVGSWVEFPGPQEPAGREDLLLTAGDGSKALTVRFRDPVHNESAPIALSITLDQAAPDVPLASLLQLVESSPAPDDPLQIDDSNNSFQLSALAGGAPGAHHLEIYADTGLSVPVVELPVAADGHADAVQWIGGHELFGSETYYVLARDAAGNPSDGTTAIATPRLSQLAVSPDPAGRGLQADGEPLDITFRCDSTLAGDPAVTVSGNQADFAEAAGGTYRYTYSPNATDTEGQNQAVVRVIAEDGSGFASGSLGTAAITMTLDITDPAVVGANLVLHESVSGTDDTIEGGADAVSDNMTATSALLIQVYDATGSTIVASGPANSDGSFGPLSIGDNRFDNVLVTAVDAVGNEGSGASVANDRSAPLVTGLTAVPVAQTDGGLVTIEFDVADNAHDLADYPTVTVGSELAALQSGTVQLPSSFAYAATVDGSAGEGVVAVEVRLSDEAGNHGLGSTQVWVDLTPPSSANSMPGALASWNGEPAVLGVAADATSGVALVEISLQAASSSLYWDGSAFASAGEVWLVASGADSWSFATGGLSMTAGSDYQLRWRATDSAGNVEAPGAGATFTFTTATQAPPTGLSAVSGEGSVLLDWTAPAGTVDHYLVYYDSEDQSAPPFAGTGATEGVSPVSVGASSTTASLSLPPGRYRFAVTAVDNLGEESGWSNQDVAAARGWLWRQPVLGTFEVNAAGVVEPGRMVMVGADGLVLLSVDSGATWSRRDSGTPYTLYDLWVGPDRELLAVGNYYAAIRSEDGGETWDDLSTSQSGGFAVWGDGAGTFVSVDGFCYIRRSVDNGESWSTFRPCTGSSPILYDVWGSGDTVIAVGSDGLIFRSPDRGANWTQVDAGGTVNDFTSVLGSDDVVLAVGRGGLIARSTDDGTSFAQVPSPTTRNLSVLWDTGASIVAAGNGALLYSADRGTTWSLVAEYNVSDIWGQQAKLVAACSYGLVLRSLDGGLHWEEVGQPAFSHLNVVIGWGQDRVASGAAGALVRAVDPDAAVWQPIADTRTGFSDVWADGELVVAVGARGTEYNSPALVWRSTDGGRTGELLEPPSPRRFTKLWGDGSRLYALAYYDGVWVSDDLGSSWQHSGLGYELHGINGEAGTVIAVGYSGRTFRSTDGFATIDWGSLSGGSTLMDVAKAGSYWIVVGTSGVVGRSSDDGLTWTHATSNVTTHLRALWTNGNTAVAVGDDGGLVRSADAGATWQALDVTDRDLYDVWGEGDTVFAVGTPGRILRSLDAGANWTATDLGSSDNFRAVLGAGGHIVVAGDGSIAESVDNGDTWSVTSEPFPGGEPGVLNAVGIVDSTRRIAVGNDGNILWHGP